MLRIHFTDADVRRTRVAAGPDPLWEAVLSLTKLRSAQLSSHHAWWRRDATRVLGGGRGWLDVLCGLVPPKGDFPPTSSRPRPATAPTGPGCWTRRRPGSGAT